MKCSTAGLLFSVWSIDAGRASGFVKGCCEKVVDEWLLYGDSDVGRGVLSGPVPRVGVFGVFFLGGEGNCSRGLRIQTC